MRPDLYRMFCPLEKTEQDEWAAIIVKPFDEYAAGLAEKAATFGCHQEVDGETVIWKGETGATEAMFFRIPDPGNLGAIRAMYDEVAEAASPLAFAFVNQRGDSRDAWDIFHMSRLSYLCHGNRVSGPGADCEP
jgi:hypothetical protein